MDILLMVMNRISHFQFEYDLKNWMSFAVTHKWKSINISTCDWSLQLIVKKKKQPCFELPMDFIFH